LINGQPTALYSSGSKPSIDIRLLSLLTVPLWRDVGYQSNTMEMGRWFDFTDPSIRDDPQWAQASKWTGWAGPLVFTILVLSIIQIVLGVLVVVDKDNDLTL
jgi:hypothetical protein